MAANRLVPDPSIGVSDLMVPLEEFMKVHEYALEAKKWDEGEDIE